MKDIDETDEDKFMSTVIEELFEYKFFMEKTSWKKESERVLMKGSRIVTCWKGTYTDIAEFK